jgi:hypothetical protein
VLQDRARGGTANRQLNGHKQGVITPERFALCARSA